MTPTSPAASVLFVCVHNAGRSQMAAGFLSHLAGDRVEVRSAGSLPGAQVNPVAVEAMREVGVDISDQRPKVLTSEAVQASDYVITMGCGDACPVFPGKTYLDWELDDPAGQGIDAVRPIRDEIRGRVEALVAEIDAKARPSFALAPMAARHAEQVLAIYAAGIAEGNATFETSAPDWAGFDAAKLPEHRFVALDGNEPGSAPGSERVLGWVAVSPVSARAAYAGVLEHSVYVHPGARGRGVGLALLEALIRSTEAAGIWTLQSGVFPENTASLALHRRAGFRELGTRERIGRLHGVWRDVVLIERRSPVVG